MRQTIITFFLGAIIGALWSILIWLIFHPSDEVFALISFSGALIIGVIVGVKRIK